MSNPLLSVCIPTFNRLESIKKLVDNFLLLQTTFLELVFTNNGSNDGTHEYFINNKFHNISYFNNENVINGNVNVLAALLNGRGKFVLLCLDKDSVNFDDLQSTFLKFLQENDNTIVFGKYDLSSIDSSYKSTTFTLGFDSVKNLAFQGSHPTGTFYKSELFHSLDYCKNTVLKNKPFPFHIDVVNSFFSMYGGGIVIKKEKVFFPEQLSQINSKGSVTYQGKNVYFLPASRFIEFKTYLFNLAKLPLKLDEKKQIERWLAEKTVQNVTNLLASFLMDKAICNHYGITNQTLTQQKKFYYLIQFCFFFLKQKTSNTLIEKIRLCLKMIKRNLVKI